MSSRNIPILSFLGRMWCGDSNWNISSEHEEFEYFMNFVETMANLTLSDFSALYDYEEDERMMNVDLAAMVQYVNHDAGRYISI